MENHKVSSYKFDCNAGEGNTLATALRKYIISGCSSWRPIGFRFDSETANSAVIADNVIQSCVKFCTTFTSLDFDLNAEGDFYEEHYTFKGRLDSDGLNNSVVKCLTPGVNLLQATDDSPISFTVYFRKSSGVHSNEENRVFLQERLNTTDRLSFSIVASVHYLAQSITFEINSFDTKDVVEMKFSDCEKGEELVKEAASVMIGRLQRLL